MSCYRSKKKKRNIVWDRRKTNDTIGFDALFSGWDANLMTTLKLVFSNVVKMR